MGWRVFLTLLVCSVAVGVGPGQPIIVNACRAFLGGPQAPIAPVVLEFDAPEPPVPAVLEFEPREPAPEFGNDLPPIVEVSPRELQIPALVAEPPLYTPSPPLHTTPSPPLYTTPSPPLHTTPSPPSRMPPGPPMYTAPSTPLPTTPSPPLYTAASPPVRTPPPRPRQAPPGCERPRFLGVIGLDPLVLPDNPVNFLAPVQSRPTPVRVEFDTPRPPSP